MSAKRLKINGIGNRPFHLKSVLTQPALWDKTEIATIFRALPPRSNISLKELYEIIQTMHKEARIHDLSSTETLCYHFCCAIDATNANATLYKLENNVLEYADYPHDQETELNRLLNRQYILKNAGETILQAIRAYRSTNQQTQQLTPRKREKPDPDWLCQIADVLNDHVKSIWDRLERYNQHRRPVSLLLQDALDKLSHTNAPGHSKSQRELIKAFEEIGRIAPDWMELVPDQNILIHPCDYQWIRSRIAGKPKALPSNEPSFTTTHFFSSPKATTSKLPPVVSAESVDVSSLTQKRRFDEIEVAEDDHDMDHLASPKKRLRINQNLIFTNADHAGGEIIKPSSFDSPRGLRQLFLRLNAGERI